MCRSPFSRSVWQALSEFSPSFCFLASHSRLSLVHSSVIPFRLWLQNYLTCARPRSRKAQPEWNQEHSKIGKQRDAKGMTNADMTINRAQPNISILYCFIEYFFWRWIRFAALPFSRYILPVGFYFINKISYVYVGRRCPWHIHIGVEAGNSGLPLCGKRLIRIRFRHSF